MTTALSSIESEFDTVEQAEAYERWVRAKVKKSLADQRAAIPHDQVMAKAQAIIDAKKKEHASRSVAT